MGKLFLKWRGTVILAMLCMVVSQGLTGVLLWLTIQGVLSRATLYNWLNQVHLVASIFLLITASVHLAMARNLFSNDFHLL